MKIGMIATGVPNLVALDYIYPIMLRNFRQEIIAVGVSFFAEKMKEIGMHYARINMAEFEHRHGSFDEGDIQSQR